MRRLARGLARAAAWVIGWAALIVVGAAEHFEARRRRRRAS